MTPLLAFAVLSPAPLADPMWVDPVWKVGDQVEAAVEIRMTNVAEELTLVETERWTLWIEKVESSAETGGAVQARLTRALTATTLNGSTAGAPPDAERAQSWTFRTDGSLAFRPKAETALEGRIFRVISALLPFNGSDPAGRTLVESPEEPGEGLPAGVFARDLRAKSDGLRAVDLTYRESGLRLGGRVSVDERNGWPLFLAFRISGLRLEGGDLPVDTVVTMTATKAKIRGKTIGLPGDPPKTSGEKRTPRIGKDGGR